MPRASRHERGYTNKWARAAKQYLKAHPTCKCGLPATCVDHITPHNMDMRLFWNRKNWQALCHACHNAKTNRERSNTGIDWPDWG